MFDGRYLFTMQTTVYKLILKNSTGNEEYERILQQFYKTGAY